MTMSPKTALQFIKDYLTTDYVNNVITASATFILELNDRLTALENEFKYHQHRNQDAGECCVPVKPRISSPEFAHFSDEQVGHKPVAPPKPSADEREQILKDFKLAGIISQDTYDTCQYLRELEQTEEVYHYNTECCGLPCPNAKPDGCSTCVALPEPAQVGADLSEAIIFLQSAVKNSQCPSILKTSYKAAIDILSKHNAGTK